MAKALRRKALYLCLLGPLSGQWRTLDEGVQNGYVQHNRAFSFGRPKKLSAIQIHQQSLEIAAGLKW